jgi:hypothetical protein
VLVDAGSVIDFMNPKAGQVMSFGVVDVRWFSVQGFTAS